MNVQGTFEVTVKTEPPYEIVDGVALSRATVDKRFSGPLDATSRVDMLAARGAVEGSAGYVAIERVRGTLEGREGTFVLQHDGRMKGGATTLTITIVPDSGTGALRGLSGRMEIRIVDGQHHYELAYELPA